MPSMANQRRVFQALVMRSDSQGCSRLRRNYLGFLAPLLAVDTLIVWSCCDSLSPAALYPMNIDESGNFSHLQPASASCSKSLRGSPLSGRARQSTSCLQAEPSGGMRAKLHQGQSEIAVNYLCASFITVWLYGGSKVRPEHDFNPVLLRRPSVKYQDLTGLLKKSSNTEGE